MAHLGSLWSPMRTSPRLEESRCAHDCSDTLISSLLEGVLIGEGAVVRRLTLDSAGSIEYPVMDITELVEAVLKSGLYRVSVWESLYFLQFYHTSVPVQQTFIWAIVQFPRVKSEACPPRLDPPVNLGRRL